MTKAAMGLVTSVYKYFVGPDESAVDPATGLSIRQKRLLVESWDIMKKDQKKYGVNLFIALFTAFPASQNFFPLFRGKAPEDLRNCSKMRAHATTLMYQITSFIDNLEDPDCLIGILEKTAKNHLNRGIGLKEFEELRSMFGSFLEEELGSQATPDVKESWDMVLSVLCSVVKDVAKEEQSTNKT